MSKRRSSGIGWAREYVRLLLWAPGGRSCLVRYLVLGTYISVKFLMWFVMDCSIQDCGTTVIYSVVFCFVIVRIATGEE